LSKLPLLYVDFIRAFEDNGSRIIDGFIIKDRVLLGDVDNFV